VDEKKWTFLINVCVRRNALDAWCIPVLFVYFDATALRWWSQHPNAPVNTTKA